MFAQRLAGHSAARITRALNDAGLRRLTKEQLDAFSYTMTELRQLAREHGVLVPRAALVNVINRHRPIVACNSLRAGDGGGPAGSLPTSQPARPFVPAAGAVAAVILEAG
jgi:hypothetical protein